jgi:predicted DNA binding CopG/RHH family protein
MTKKAKKVKQRVSLSVDSDIVEAAKKEASKEDRSLSNYVQSLIKKHLKIK